MTLIKKSTELEIDVKIKMLIYGQAGIGKAQPIYANVLTPNGFRKISELKIGDSVIGLNGKIQTVLGIYPQGVRPVYKLTTNDDSIAFCDEEHIWTVRHSTGNSRKAGFRNYTLKQMLEKGIICPQTPREKETGRKAMSRFELPVIEASIFEEKQFDIHPYILGILIGDGSLTESVATFSNPDIDYEIYHHACNVIEKGFLIERYEHPSCPKCHIVMEVKKGSGYINRIKNLKLNVTSKNKFIPEKYMLGSISQRYDLLRGLMDTDGSANKNRICFSSSSEILAHDVKNLVLSLGGIAKIHVYKRKDKGTEYRVNINTPECPFFLKRKAEEWSRHTISRYIIDAEKIENCECICIKVSNDDELYVTDNYIVTHNTTISISAPKPLLFDFDGGIHRVNFAHLEGVDTVQVGSYDDFLEVLNNEDLSAYESLVIDTGGKALDYMATYLIKKNSKLGKSNGTLTLQGYGERKAEFSALCKRVSSLNKHIIFVAHRETRQDGDDMKYVPLFGGSNYDSLVTELDLVGYLEANGRKRTITFDPTSRNDGKNTCNLPAQMNIPNIVDEKGNATAPNNFLTENIIKPYVARLQERKEMVAKYDAIISDLSVQIDLITDEKTANEFIGRINNFEHVGSSKLMAAHMLNIHCKNLGLVLNAKTKRYEAAPIPPAAPAAKPASAPTAAKPAPAPTNQSSLL